MTKVEYTFRTPHGRLTESFYPTTTIHEVRKSIGIAIGCEVADLLVGFPPKPVEGYTLEAVHNNQVITIAEGEFLTSNITNSILKLVSIS